MKIVTVDMFGGGAGWAEAARLAAPDEIDIVLAANHNEHAVAAYRVNSPRTRVVQQDLEQADFSAWPRPDLLLGSPACQGHTKVSTGGKKGKGKPRGSAPKHDRDRATAWAMLTCAEVHLPRWVVIENVLEMQDWVFYERWLGGFRDLRYHVKELVLEAADHGVPQERERLFIFATLDPLPDLKLPPPRPWVPARSFIDLRQRSGWQPVRHAAPGVRQNCERGRENFPHGPFVTNNVTDHPGRCIDRPLGTVTTATGHWGVVRPSPTGDEYRPLTIAELRTAMGFRRDHWLPRQAKAAVRLLGNAVPPPLGAVPLRMLLGKEAA